ncbi:MAG: alkaline phosphatase family protein, partial [Prevotella sp.]|nr:alkaline phosphatase family protein [Prevotella sp.]
TTHGYWNPYDCHIPFVLMGWDVPHGSCPEEVHITDIAPTICNLVHIQMPNGCIGTPRAMK